ncbi:MAG: anti-sigma factor antagonist [Spirochaetes bacterium]|nr:MAG: anti-sigma factor antagonist [Spirochaetota bacterium]
MCTNRVPEIMKTSRLITDKYALLRVEGSLTNENIQTFSEEIERLMEERTNLVLDFSEVSFICSATLGLLLRFNQNFNRENRAFVIFGVHEDIMKIFTITEVSNYLSLHPTQKEALEYMDARIARQ